MEFWKVNFDLRNRQVIWFHATGWHCLSVNWQSRQICPINCPLPCFYFFFTMLTNAIVLYNVKHNECIFKETYCSFALNILWIISMAYFVLIQKDDNLFCTTKTKICEMCPWHICLKLQWLRHASEEKSLTFSHD